MIELLSSYGLPVRILRNVARLSFKEQVSRIACYLSAQQYALLLAV